MPVILFYILLILSPLTFYLSYQQYQAESNRPVVFVPGGELLANLPMNRLERIEIKRKDGSISLSKVNNNFVVASSNNYPARTSEVNDFLRKCSMITRAELITKEKNHHDKFDLSSASAKKDYVEVSFFESDGKVLSGFIAGQKHAKRNGNYIRESQKDTVYVTKNSINIPSKGMEFIDKTLLNINRSEISTLDTGSVKLIATGSTFKLLGIPAGKQAKGTDYLSTSDALSQLSFDDFIDNSGEKAKKLVYDHTFKASLKNQTEYELKLAKSGEDHYLKLTGIWTGQQELKLPKDAPKEELEKLEAKIKLNQSLNQNNLLWNKWVYKIPKHKYEQLTKSLDSLLEDKKSEATDKAAPAANPHLSHILISYEGAERSQVKGRTKVEAKKRADEVLKKVQDAPEKFAEFAAEYSDGPSKSKGGSLGEVKKGQMVPAFEKAGFALQPGTICKMIVETPFGYHVIMRLK